MSAIVNARIEDYLQGLLPERDEVLAELEAEAARLDFPAVGPQVGRLLHLLARAVNARRILELGSGYGYSGIWLARALPADGRLLLCDSDPAKRDRAMASFRRLGLDGRVDYRLGDALEIAGRETGPFDLLFNDVDKEAYPLIPDLAWPLLRPGGLLVTDNTLWHGRVAARRHDAATRAVRAYNERLAAHAGFFTVQLPLRDGVAVSLRH